MVIVIIKQILTKISFNMLYITVTASKQSNLLWVGDVYCRHLKTTFVESWTATKFLDYLHHHPLQK